MQTKAEQIRKALLKKENEIVRGNKMFCAHHNIEWTKIHDDCLRNALRTFFAEGFYSIAKDLFYSEPPKTKKRR